MQLTVYCTWKNNGCQWIDQRSLLEEHISVCSFGTVACSNRGCSVDVIKTDLQQHVEMLCDFRAVECSYCKEPVVFGNLNAHTTMCPKVPVSCPNDCGSGETISREDLASHMEICPRKVVACSIVGCTFKGWQQKVDTHTETSLPLHLSNINDELQHLQLEVSSLEGRTKDMMDSPTCVSKDKEMATDDREQRISLVESQLRELESHQKIMQQKTVEACYMSVDNIQKQFKSKMESLNQQVGLLTEKCIKFEEVVSMQTARIRQLEGKVSHYRQTEGEGPSPGYQQQFTAQDRVLATHDIKLAEYSLRLDMMDCKNTDGVLLWKITDIRRRRRDAVIGKTPSVYSQPFYTSTNGYKMCARLYLNGDGMGRGSHLSLFFVVMRGEYDSLLPWPFRQKVALALMDQEGQRHISDTFRPDPMSSSFQRPTNEMNVASGCPLFVPLSTLDGGDYIKDDVLFLKMVVDGTSLHRPDAR